MPDIVRFDRIGGPDVLRIGDEPLQEPGPGEVRLCVQALGLNRAEALFRSGDYIYSPRLPSRLGYEASGIVDAVGPGVADIVIGDSVSLLPTFLMTDYGVYGESTLAPVDAIAKNPPNVLPEQMAASWIQYFSAWGALVELGHIEEGDVVLITAASSSVGYAAVQVARAAGAIPIATTRTPQKVAALTAGGFDHVIVTDDEDLAGRVLQISDGHGADLILDAVAGPGLETLATAAAPGATIFEYGNLSAAPAPYPLLTAMEKGLTIRGYLVTELATNPQARERGRDYVLEGLRTGRLDPVIDRTFGLDDIVQAHQYLESNQQNGKIVVTV